MRNGHTMNHTTRAVTAEKPREMSKVTHHLESLKPSTDESQGKQIQINTREEKRREKGILRTMAADAAVKKNKLKIVLK